MSDAGRSAQNPDGTEREIGRLIAAGRSNSQIAAALNLPLDHVKRRVLALEERLGGDREAVAAWHRAARSRSGRPTLLAGALCALLLGILFFGRPAWPSSNDDQAVPARSDGSGDTRSTAAQSATAAPGVLLPQGRVPQTFPYLLRPGETPAAAASRFGVPVETVMASSFDFTRNFAGEASDPNETGSPHGVDIPVGADALSFVRFGMTSPDALGWAEPPPLAWPLSGRVAGVEQEPRLTSLDLVAGPGVPVLAAASGTVLVTAIDPCRFGRHILVDHGNGYATLYAQVSGVIVEAGDVIQTGDQLASSGTDGFVQFGLMRGDYYLFPGLVMLVLCL